MSLFLYKLFHAYKHDDSSNQTMFLTTLYQTFFLNTNRKHPHIKLLAGSGDLLVQRPGGHGASRHPAVLGGGGGVGGRVHGAEEARVHPARGQEHLLPPAATADGQRDNNLGAAGQL